jgi:hypothetical protein
MRCIATRRTAFWGLVAVSSAPLLLMGCFSASPVDTGPADGSESPVVVAEFEILDLHGTSEDPSSDGTCQTGASIQLRAFRKAADGSVDEQSYDPQGQALRFTWTDEVDFSDGTGRHPSVDWGLDEGDNIVVTDHIEIGKQLYTIAIHYVTLTVTTRDGRSASHEFRFTVTACEECGTEG